MRDIAVIRSELHAANNYAARATLFLELLMNPGFEWHDLLRELEFGGLTGEMASFELHKKLQIEIGADGINRDRDSWLAILQAAKVEVDYKCGPASSHRVQRLTPHASPPSER